MCGSKWGCIQLQQQGVFLTQLIFAPLIGFFSLATATKAYKYSAVNMIHQKAIIQTRGLKKLELP